MSDQRHYDLDVLSHEKFDFTGYNIDWKGVDLKEEEKGRWSFTVRDRKMGRAIGLEFVKALEIENQSEQILKYRAPIHDLRLESQTSYMEYDEELEHDGDINIIEIFMRHGQENSEEYDRYMNGINYLIDRINQAKQKS